MRRRRLRRWARPSRTRLNPYTLMINSSRVLSLQNGDYGVQDESICEATHKSCTRLNKSTIYGFVHKSIRNPGNVRILSRFRNPSPETEPYERGGDRCCRRSLSVQRCSGSSVCDWCGDTTQWRTESCAECCDSVRLIIG